MYIEDLDKRIAEANEEFISEEEEVLPSPVDIYDERQKIGREYNKKVFSRGARAIVLATTQDVVNGAGVRSLASAYKRAKDESESLEKAGDSVRAQMVRNTYMMDSFLPAVEVIIGHSSPDELLNCPKALEALDKYALGGVQGASMSGFTEGYVREAYANLLGRTEPLSSPEVTKAVERINGYLDTGQMSIGKGLATKIKDKISEGKAFASESDYAFILRVADSHK